MPEKQESHLDNYFRWFSARVSDYIGSVRSLIVTLILIVGTGIYFGFSEGWKNNTNLIVTILTFLVLFFLQKSQNIGDKATHLKLDELIRTIEGTRDEVLFAENKSENEIETMKEAMTAGTEDETVSVE